jgi:hypothetical protein
MRHHDFAIVTENYVTLCRELLERREDFGLTQACCGGHFRGSEPDR